MPKPSYHRLRKQERYIIKRLRKAGNTQQHIAAILGRSQSTISKELSRNRGGHGYRPKQAERKAQARQRLKRPRGRMIEGELQEQVRERLKRKYSPEQIRGSLRAEGRKASSVTSIYSYIQSDRRKGGELYTHLRINGKRRYRHRNKASRCKIRHRIDITQRPGIVEERTRYGDWEVDLVEGKGRAGYILSLYERKSRFGQVVKVSAKRASRVARAIIKTLRGYRVHTLTYDNGHEFAAHRQVNKALRCASYFCRPYHSWEKGGVENYNGLLRQYLPKTTCLRELDKHQLTRIQNELNDRPRKTLNYRSPATFKHHLLA